MTEKTDGEKTDGVNEPEEYVCDDPVILDAFSDLKLAILAKRTDIVRQILSAAQSLREDDEYDSDGEERSKKDLVDKYDSEEYIDLLSLLLNHRDTDSGTLLHYATRIDSADIARTLLSAGANCTIINKEKRNPYNYCASESMTHVYVGELMQVVSQSRKFRIEQLLAAGIDVNSSDGAVSGNTVLHWAVSFADLPTVKLIIEKGGNVNGINADGVTPLHDAIQRGDKDIVEELLKNGADASTKPVKGNLEGKSPINLASKDSELKHLLDQYVEQETVNNTEKFATDESYTDTGDESMIKEKHILRKSLSISSTQSFSQPSILPALMQVDPMVKYLCPPPQKIKQFQGLFFVLPTDHLTVQIISSKEHVNSMKDVLNLFTKKFENIGINLSVVYNRNAFHNSLKTTHLQCIINENTFTHKEEYKIQINTHKVLIISSCIVSMFRGISTFLQSLRLFRGRAIPLLQISDWPTNMHRSITLDFHENDLPNLELLCETVDTLALFKVNQIQLNVLHIGEQKDKCSYTLQEFFTFQMYCQKRFIDVVPYIVIDEYSKYISNVSNDTLELNEEKLMNQVDLFASAKSIHVDVSATSSAKIIQQLHHFCTSRNYHLQITSNQIDMHLEHMTLLLHSFSYTVSLSDVNELERSIAIADNLGLQCIVCYENNSLSRLYPNIMNVMYAVHEISYQLPKYNCSGFSIKLSSETKKLCNFASSLPTLVMASSMGWNVPKELDEALVKNVINYQIYEDDSDMVGNLFVSMGNSLPLTNSRHSLFDDMLAYCSVDLPSLATENLQDVCKTIKVLKQDLQKMKLGSPLSKLLLEESTSLLNVMFFLSRICYGVLNLQLKIESPNLDDLTQLHKSDNSNRLMTLINEYESYCTKYYKSSQTGYVSADLLRELLRKILPKNTNTSGFFSVFTV